MNAKEIAIVSGLIEAQITAREQFHEDGDVAKHAQALEQARAVAERTPQTDHAQAVADDRKRSGS